MIVTLGRYAVARLIRGIRLATLWKRSVAYMEKENYQAAKETLLKLDRTTGMLHGEKRLLYAVAMFKLGSLEDCAVQIRLARAEMGRSQFLSRHEINYLNCYADRIWEKLVHSGLPGVDDEYYGSFAEIDERRIPNYMRHNFPL